MMNNNFGLGRVRLAYHFGDELVEQVCSEPRTHMPLSHPLPRPVLEGLGEVRGLDVIFA
jgi:hypothetical protein